MLIRNLRQFGNQTTECSGVEKERKITRNVLINLGKTFGIDISNLCLEKEEIQIHKVLSDCFISPSF